MEIWKFVIFVYNIQAYYKFYAKKIKINSTYVRNRQK
jgi:hypothetical protein